MLRLQDNLALIPLESNSSLTLMREDDTRKVGAIFVGLFLTQTHTMPCQPEGLGLHIYSC